jgi:ribosomal protein L2
LSFISGFELNPHTSKNYSTHILSSGEVYYILSTYLSCLFKTAKLRGIFSYNSLLNYSYVSKYTNVAEITYIVYNLPKFKYISYLEILPNKGAQYVRSSGSKSFIIKLDPKVGLSLVKLPSGIHKSFSIYSIASLGLVPFSIKNIKTQANAGFFTRKGSKPLVRGVAKNPIDHPHGGRNKAIKYQRTP